MFGFDPIDLYDPSPYGPLAYYGHLVIGTITLLAALGALATKKGSKVHRVCGWTFLVCVALVCLTSISMLANVFIAPLFMAVFTAIYAAGGAWLALRKATTQVRFAEFGLTLFEIAGLVYFLSIALPAVSVGSIPPFAPVVIAFIPVVLLIGDAHWFLNAGRRKELRLRRHLARMIWAFVVVLRAPLVELVAAGLPIPQPVVVTAPILLAVIMIWYFQRKYGRAGR